MVKFKIKQFLPGFSLNIKNICLSAINCIFIANIYLFNTLFCDNVGYSKSLQ